MLTDKGPHLPAAAAFHTTRWTRVRAARDDSEEGQKALAELCETYYEPVLSYLRHELRQAEPARDVAHAFFAQMLAGGTLRRAESGQGRFRCYLLGALKHFLSHQRGAAAALKRGGGTPHVFLDAEEASSVRAIPDPQAVRADAEFDRRWALVVLEKALASLRAQWADEGKEKLFEQLKPWLTGEAVRGDQMELAATCGMSVPALKMAVQRMRQRYRACIHAELAGTLNETSMVEEEMRALLAALSTPK